MHDIILMYRCRQFYIFISKRRTIIIMYRRPAASIAAAQITAVALQIDIILFVLYLCSAESPRTRCGFLFYIRRSHC